MLGISVYYETQPNISHYYLYRLNFKSEFKSEKGSFSNSFKLQSKMHKESDRAMMESVTESFNLSVWGKGELLRATHWNGI